MKSGLLLINLGTPKSIRFSDVWTFLSEFLLDKRVINLPVGLRFLLVYGFILPFRTHSSAHAYSLIWTKSGSPLLVNSQNLKKQLQKKLGTQTTVALGMRYSEPSIKKGLEELKTCERITILPLYPQYSSATTGSAIEMVFKELAPQEILPYLKIIREFYKHPAYIKAQAQFIKMYIQKESHVIFSYHGIPVNQLVKGGCQEPCNTICRGEPVDTCYRAQCYHTSQLLAQELGLVEDQYVTSFQSRLGKTPWIKPYTDEIFIKLASEGIRHITVVSPSFVTDCLETLEELGIRAKETWLSLGGKEFILVPGMNDHPLWVNALIEIVGEH